VDHEG
jgi:hypothetical protein